jgi:hypothetical protein
MHSLFSVFDEISGHKRRYDPGDLGQLFVEIGLDSVVEHGIFRSTLLAQRIARRGFQRDGDRRLTHAEEIEMMRRSFRIPFAPINAALKQLCALERRLGFPISVGKGGASQLAVGRVSDPAAFSAP